jgi:YVTN family beta-propeller protein
LELRKTPFLLAILLGVMISISTIVLSHNNASAQTYDTMTKQGQIFKKNPQIPLGPGAPFGPKVNSAPPWMLGYAKFNERTHKYYVSGPGVVYSIDSDSRNVSTISVGEDPQAMAVVSKAGHTVVGYTGKNHTSGLAAVYDYSVPDKIYVANAGSDTVSVINATTDKKEPNDIDVGESPVAIAGFNGKIYVANARSGTVSVINATTDKKEPYHINVGYSPDAIMRYEQCINTAIVYGSTSIFPETDDLNL